MRTVITRLFTAVLVLIFNVAFVSSQTVELRFNQKLSGASSITFGTGDVLYFVDATTVNGSNSNVCFTTPYNIRYQHKVGIIELKSTSASSISVYGMSSGSTSTRTIFQVSVSDTKDGDYTLLDDVTWTNTKITSNIYGQESCGTSTVSGLNIAKGKFVKISYCTGTSGGSTQNLNVSGFDILPASTNPEIKLSTGQNPADVMETVAMEPIVFAYSNVNDAANVVYNWYTDNTYTATTTAPADLSITKDTEAKTVTVSGTPATGTAGTYYYKVGVNETNGNVIEASIVVSTFAASADKYISNLKVDGKTPDFNAESHTYSLVVSKAASLTQPVTFDIPATASANFTSGDTHDFTNPLIITVTAQDASQQIYTVNVVTGIADIAYVVNTAISANDTKIYPMLKSKGYYLDVIPATGTDIEQFNNHDLVILNEEPNSSNTLAVAMGQLIGVKPFLNFKAYMYGKTNWPAGAGYNGSSDTGVLVEEAYLAHPVFSGVTIDGGLLQILNTSISGNGIQAVTNPGSGNVIAKLPSRTTDVTLVELNDVSTAKFFMIPISNVNYGNVTDNGLKLIENVVLYLLSSDKFVTTGNNEPVISRIFFDGNKIHNPQGEMLKVFDTTGRLMVKSSDDVYLGKFQKGMFVVMSDRGYVLKALK